MSQDCFNAPLFHLYKIVLEQIFFEASFQSVLISKWKIITKPATGTVWKVERRPYERLQKVTKYYITRKTMAIVKDKKYYYDKIKMVEIASCTTYSYLSS